MSLILDYRKKRKGSPPCRWIITLSDQDRTTGPPWHGRECQCSRCSFLFPDSPKNLGTILYIRSDFAVDAANPAYANSTSNSTVAALSSSTLGSTSSVASAQPTTAPQNKSSSSDTTALGAGLGAGIGSALVLAGLAFYFLRRWRSARSAGSYNDNQSGTQPSPISYAPSAGWASYNGKLILFRGHAPRTSSLTFWRAQEPGRRMRLTYPSFRRFLEAMESPAALRERRA